MYRWCCIIGGAFFGLCRLSSAFLCLSCFVKQTNFNSTSIATFLTTKPTIRSHIHIYMYEHTEITYSALSNVWLKPLLVLLSDRAGQARICVRLLHRKCTRLSETKQKKCIQDRVSLILSYTTYIYLVYLHTSARSPSPACFTLLFRAEILRGRTLHIGSHAVILHTIQTTQLCLVAAFVILAPSRIVPSYRYRSWLWWRRGLVRGLVSWWPGNV